MITVKQMKDADILWRFQLLKPSIIDIYNSVISEYGYRKETSTEEGKFNCKNKYAYFFGEKFYKTGVLNIEIWVICKDTDNYNFVYSCIVYDSDNWEIEYEFNSDSLQELEKELRKQFKEIGLYTKEEAMIRDIIE